MAYFRVEKVTKKLPEDRALLSQGGSSIQQEKPTQHLEPATPGGDQEQIQGVPRTTNRSWLAHKELAESAASSRDY